MNNKGNANFRNPTHIQRSPFNFRKMKKIKSVPAFLLLMCVPFLLGAQNDCKVLMPEIDSSYTGKCKKGLAHGNGFARGKDSYEGRFKKGWPDGGGTYSWSSGEVYKGNFIEGMKDGEGYYTFTINGQDTVLYGLWKNDVYIGPIPKKPKVHQQVSVDRYNFKKISDVQNRVLIDFYQNGGRNAGIRDLLIAGNSGYETTLGHSKGYIDMTFPFTMTIKYTTPNKLQTRLVYCIFEFTIYEAGDWRVELFN